MERSGLSPDVQVMTDMSHNSPTLCVCVCVCVCVWCVYVTYM